MIPLPVKDLQETTTRTVSLYGGSRLEEDLLLHCARITPRPEMTERMRALMLNGVDWEYLLTTGRHHGLLPLLYWNLKSSLGEIVPAGVQEELRDHFQRNALRNLFLSGEMLRIVQLFREHGLGAIPFKGPVLAASIYGETSLREFIDLDILVRKQDLVAARDLLMREGYAMDTAMTKAQQDARLRSGCAITLSRRDGKAIVDLHWEFTALKFSLPFDLDNLWGRLETVSIAGRQVATLSVLDHLMLVSIHGAKHRWERLEWICDVAGLLLVQPKLNWERCLEESTKLRAERILLHALLLANKYLGAKLPPIVHRKLQADPVAHSLAARAGENLFSESSTALVTADETAFHLQMREQFSDRMPYVLYQVRRWMIPTERDRSIFRLPAFLSFLYYLFRPARLLFEYGLHPLSQFLKNFRLRKS